MLTRIINQVAPQFARLFVLVLAALASSGAGAQTTHANPPGSRGQVPSFQPGQADASADPTVTWNTFLWGIEQDQALAVAIDGNDNIYITGVTNSNWGSPVRPYTSSPYDAFVAKLNPAGTLVWNTFLGGGGTDSGEGIALDVNGNVYVVGQSNATWGSPLRHFSDVTDGFAAKLSPTGELIWNTFLGGSGIDSLSGIAVDGMENVYVAGVTWTSWGFPVLDYSGQADAFAAKLSPGGTLLWNSFLGAGGLDVGSGVALDGSGNIYVAGDSDTAWGSPVRDYTALTDAFVAELSPSGGLEWNTFVGGTGYDGDIGIALDGNGNIYIAGATHNPWASPNPPANGPDDAFAAKLSPTGGLLWNTFLGGSGYDYASAVALDPNGNAYVAGQSTASWGSPIRPYAGAKDEISPEDGFAAELSADGQVLWNAFLGGTSNDFGRGIGADKRGNVFVVGESWDTWGSPLRPFSGWIDAFVVRIDQAPVRLPMLMR